MRFFRRKRKILKILLGASLLILALKLGLLLLRHSELEPEDDQLGEGPYMILDTKNPPQEGVILLEGYGSPRLTPRMWCALESAARAHPDTQVSQLMTSTIIRDTPLLHTLKEELPNIQLLHLDAASLFKDSVLEQWYREKMWETSYWPKSHFTDILRWMILQQYGGIYLDLDVVVVRSLSSLPNCTGLESDRWAAAGVLKFSPGHPVIEGCIERIAEHFDGTVWGANGPEIITEVLQKLCGLELPSGKTPLCQDLTVMPTKAFYPIPWWEWRRYVTDDEDLSRDLLSDESVYALHMWNLHSRHTRVALNSQQPYAHAARIHCPTTVFHQGSYL